MKNSEQKAPVSTCAGELERVVVDLGLRWGKELGESRTEAVAVAEARHKAVPKRGDRKSKEERLDRYFRGKSTDLTVCPEHQWALGPWASHSCHLC